MKQRIFIFDGSRCFGCHGCVAACANVNRTAGGLFWRRLLKLPPEDGGHETLHLSLACNHCEHPPCVAGCPSGALKKRASDGVVIHHAKKCVGCRYCRMVCPYDAIRWDGEAGIVGKCHLCHERLDQGREPACVETCFSGALSQILVEEPDPVAMCEKEAPGFHHQEEVGPSIRFILRKEGGRPAGRPPFPPAPVGADGSAMEPGPVDGDRSCSAESEAELNREEDNHGK